MNVDEAWRQLGTGEDLPLEALQWSLDHWGEAAPRFISKLRNFAAGAKLGDDDLSALFFAIHLCAEKREERAYGPLCQILQREADIYFWLGDSTTETLAPMLINLFDGDAEPLQRVLEAAGADPFARAAALHALGFLVRERAALPDEAMRAYLLERGAALTSADCETLGPAWAVVVGALGYDTLSSEVARAFSRGAVSNETTDIKHFYGDLKRAKADPDGLAVFRDEHIEPFGSTIETFAGGADADEGGEAGVRIDDGETPYVNPHRDVGRNDPCPCGSGKKYKKCCLAA